MRALLNLEQMRSFSHSDELVTVNVSIAHIAHITAHDECVGGIGSEWFHGLCVTPHLIQADSEAELRPQDIDRSVESDQFSFGRLFCGSCSNVYHHECICFYHLMMAE
jgi:hypothetical protein